MMKRKADISSKEKKSLMMTYLPLLLPEESNLKKSKKKLNKYRKVRLELTSWPLWLLEVL